MHSSRLRSLRYAKQRFDSTSKPIGRACLFTESLIATAERIVSVRGRTSDEGKRALVFLRTLDVECLLTLAMIADSGDESLMITRVADQEDMDHTGWLAHCDQYMTRLRLLFEERFVLKSGYTKFMLDFLNARRVYFVEGRAHSVGGPGAVTQAVLDRCCSRFLNWVVLVDQILRAEYPSFEVPAAFSVFNLSKRCHDVTSKLNRLATHFRIDPDVLVREHEAVHMQARLAFEDAGIDANPMCCWLSAAKAANAACLASILPSVSAFGGSTSGVEQAFSLGAWALEGRRQLSGEASCSELKIVVDTQLPVSGIIKGAQSSWVRRKFGKPRASGPVSFDERGGKIGRTLRRDFGVKRPHSSSATEAAFIARRRLDVSEAAGQSQVEARSAASTDTAPPVRRARAMWTAKHDEEVKFNLAKRFDNLCDGVYRGSISSEELSDDMLHLVILELQRRSKARRRTRATHTHTSSEPSCSEARPSWQKCIC